MSDQLRDLGYVGFHTIVIYLSLILGLRFVGRRQLGQLTVIDLVVVILLGSAVETAMVAGNTTLPAGLVSAATLLFCNRLLAVLSFRSKRLRKFVAGNKMLLINNGRVVEENLRRAGLTREDLLVSVRARGHADLDDIRYAIQEADGSVNIVPMESSPEPLRNDTVLASPSATATPA